MISKIDDLISNLKTPKQTPTEKIIETSSQTSLLQYTNKSISNNNNETPNKWLFEEFMVIGIEKEDLRFVGDSLEVPQSKILYSYPRPLEKIKEYTKYIISKRRIHINNQILEKFNTPIHISFWFKLTTH